MAGSVNKVILVGNLGADPESRSFANGGEVVNLSLATSDSWTDKASGERKEKTEWHRVVIYNENLGRVAKQYLRKGSKVYLEGAVQTRKYTDGSGQEKYTTEIVLQRFNGELVLLDKRDDAGGARSNDGWGGGERQGGSGGYKSGGSPGGGAGRGGPAPFDSDLDDDVPF